jgi:hypothetical protein
VCEAVSLIEDCLLFLIKTKPRRAIVAAQSGMTCAHAHSLVRPYAVRLLRMAVNNEYHSLLTIAR